MDPKIGVVYEACFGKREYGPCLAKPLPMPARAKVKWGTWKMETILPRVNRYIEMMQNLNSKKLWIFLCDFIQLENVIPVHSKVHTQTNQSRTLSHNVPPKEPLSIYPFYEVIDHIRMAHVGSWISSQTYLGTPSMLSLPPSLQALIILGVSWEYCPHNQGSGLNIQRRELYPSTIEIPTGWQKTASSAI